MKKIKELCKANALVVERSSTKDNLCEQFGMFLIQSKKVEIIDEEKDITFTNLKKNSTVGPNCN